MFDFRLFGLIAAAALVSVVVCIPRQARALLAVRGGDPVARNGWPTIAAIVQTGVLALAAAAVGTALSGAVGLGAPAFAALAAGRSPLPELWRQLVPALLLGGVGWLVLMPAYYGVFRRWLDPGTVALMEEVRLRMGLTARVLFGGVVEEVVYRWGAMTLLAWLLSAPGASGVPVMWGSIVGAGLLFGLGHLPGALALGMRLTPALWGTVMLLNLWVGAVCGWLFWRHGLTAAIMAHALVHVLWLPLDRRFVVDRRLAGAVRPSRSPTGGHGDGP